MERSLIAEFESNVSKALETLQITRDSGHHKAAVALASLPEKIRGYGHVRERGVEAARKREAELLAALQRRVIPLKKAA